MDLVLFLSVLHLLPLPLLLVNASVLHDRKGRESIGWSSRMYRRDTAAKGLHVGSFDPRIAMGELSRIKEKFRDAEDILSSPSVFNITSACKHYVAGGCDVQTVQQPLRDYMLANEDVAYYGTMKFGVPDSTIEVEFDTGSADLWVPKDAMHSKTMADTGQRFEMTYDSGSVSGTFAKDSVFYWDARPKLFVRDQTFGVVDQDDGVFEWLPKSGVMGMAFSTVSRGRSHTFFENLIGTGQVETPLFGMHFARHQMEGSTICWGCIDWTKFRGGIRWFPLKAQTWWIINMDRVLINDTPPILTNLTACIDTGTANIFVPDRVAVAFYSRIPGAERADLLGDGFWTYPCSQAEQISISLVFNGTTFSIDPRDWLIGTIDNDGETCIGGVFSLPDTFRPQDFAIVGTMFLKSWYSIFDYSNGGQVGFARSINN